MSSALSASFATANRSRPGIAIDAFGADTGGQELEELGRIARTLVREHGDEIAALGVDEDQPLVAEGRDLHTLRLDALGLGALDRIMAVAHGEMLEQVAGIPEHLAGGVEDA